MLYLMTERIYAMKKFIHENFLLETKEASILYHEYAQDLPIIDFHNHLPPAEIAGDIRFKNITKLWLGGDHYKWRAMRTLGVDEKFITGKASDWEKFSRWSAAMPYCLRNPLYHWSHLELARYFSLDKLLGPDTAEEIYNTCNEMLKIEEFSSVNILRRMNVEALCTTDDPVDSLEHHIAYKKNGSSPALFPAWRPDRAMKIENVEMFNAWVNLLETASGTDITDFSDFIEALEKRQAFFHEHGCRLADHGIETFYTVGTRESEISKIFAEARSGIEASPDETAKFKGYMLYRLSLMNHAKGWVQQYHFGVLRNNSSRMFKRLGPDTGYDCMGDFTYAENLVALLDRLDSENSLAKTVLYPINPADNGIVATIIGSFQEGPVKGKLQLGSAWWFLDQKGGMEEQMNTLSLMGLLSTFIGMATDSRSFLSFPRHEYFRRILCNLMGNDIAKGLLPADFNLAGRIIKDICYSNARKYLRLE
jgi:glucuronate isomerase